MTTDKVNYLNIGLMAISLVAAFLLPFEVFLFSYAILGPAHYLTEISWLHDRKYFSPGKFDSVPLFVFSALILLGGGAFVFGNDIYNYLSETSLEPFLAFLGDYGYDITFVAFGTALIFILTRNTGLRVGGMILLLVAATLMHTAPPEAPDAFTSQRQVDNFNSALQNHYYNPYWAIFAVYLPTLLHVYVFTGAFIIFGALKRDSRTGYISFAFFIFCMIACFIFFPNTSYYTAGEWAVSSYGKTFTSLSESLLAHFGGQEFGTVKGESIFSNPLSVMFARFIAFAYTYHYLNWFSKTSIIRWHKVPKLRFMAVVLLWIASIGLYLWDYTIGFRWLFLLSFAHVLLEFPLNHQSFIGIGKEIGMRIRGEKGKATSAKGKATAKS